MCISCNTTLDRVRSTAFAPSLSQLAALTIFCGGGLLLLSVEDHDNAALLEEFLKRLLFGHCLHDLAPFLG